MSPASSPPPKGDKLLEGEVASVIFSTEKTGFAVLRLDVSGQGSVIVVGSLAGRLPGELLSLRGQWQSDPSHGRQFRATSAVSKRPTSQEGLKRYLSSGLVPGIGKTLAGRLVDELGEKLPEALEGDIPALTSVWGISRQKAEALVECWSSASAEREALVELEGLGFGAAISRRIWERFGARTLVQLEENPYAFIGEVRGIGFRSADRVALEMGVPRDSDDRAKALIHHLMKKASDSGHACLTVESLESRGPEFGMPSAQILRGLNLLSDEGGLVIEDDEYAYLPWLHRAEREVAERFVTWPAPEAEPLGVEDALEEIERSLDLALGDEQRLAVRRALAEPVLVITGGPGTGKTTMVRALVALFSEIPGGILMGTPTGRAAKRLADVTGKSASTLHRLLEATPGGFARDRSRPLEAGVLLVDEASMIDLPLFQALLAALRQGARLILIGDADQLPPVGPGEIFRDLVETQVVPVVRLKTLFRQDSNSLIAKNARRIMGGDIPELPRGAASRTSDFFFLETPDTQVSSVLCQLVTKRLPKAYGIDPLKDLQVLTPGHKGGAGTVALNRSLQELFQEKKGPTIPLGSDDRIGVGDRIMQTRNNYQNQLFNGDVGEVLKVFEKGDPGGPGLVALFDEREVQLSAKELQDISLAYAMTVHKAQGCEYPAVVIPVVSQHTALLSRNLIYTAITRAKVLVVLVGSWRVFVQGISRTGRGRRFSRFRERLCPPLPLPDESLL